MRVLFFCTLSFGRVVGFNGFGLNDNGGVIALDVLAFGRHRPRDIASRKGDRGHNNHSSCY